MYTRTRTHTHVRTHANTHTPVHACTHTCIHVRACTHILAHAYAYTLLSTCVLSLKYFEDCQIYMLWPVSVTAAADVMRRVHDKLARPEAGVEVTTRAARNEREMVAELQNSASSALGQSRTSCFIGGAGTSVEEHHLPPGLCCLD